MKTYLDCLPCFINQTLKVASMITDDVDIHETLLRKALLLTSQIDLRQSPPAMSREIYKLVRDVTGVKDPYDAIKKECNAYAMKLYPKIKSWISQSDDPFETAVRLSIAGNIIDFGTGHEITEELVDEVIADALHAPLDMESLERLRLEIEEAESILYLGDNAGEIVFDKALIEIMPMEKITFAVRGHPIINDITMEDAQAVGMTELVTVIDNGYDAPGTILEKCSDEFQQCFEKADLIIAKGQGNFETLSETSHEICFLFKVKCEIITRYTQKEQGSIIIQFNGAKPLSEPISVRG